ncbi:MAG: glycosyltransferase family 39 protein [Candidatus Marinimicrobia bacterium]|nr:glycosyltransferase family 39 protein [Candidatus Neomarinimicrobiota bacterium]
MNINRNHFIFGFIIILILFCGLKISEDYGISVDEDARRNGGRSFVKYIAEGIGIDHPSFKYIPKVKEYNNAWMAPYGMIFEIPATLLEHIFGIDEKSNIFLFRHKLTFIIHFIGIIVFFLFAKEIFGSNRKALFASLVYCLHPRIFGHSFFNPKDIIFLSTVSMSLYPSIKFLKTDSKKWMIYTGIFLGLAMSVRLVGIYLPFLVLLFYGGIIINKPHLSFSAFRDYFCKSAVIVLLSLTVLYILTPYYWTNPILSFIETFSIAKNFPWNGNNYFLGSYINATHQNSWYYLPFWFAITTPISFLVLFIFGNFIVIYRLSKSVYKYKYILFCILGIIIPFSILIILSSTLYDGWRHFFFTYPFSTIIISFGMFQLMSFLKLYYSQNYQLIMRILLICIFSGPAYSIIKLHPYQQVYFNALVGKDPMRNFEGDYWGTTYRRGFEWISENTTEDTVRIWLGSGFGKGIGITWKNIWFIEKEKRRKIIIVDLIESKRLNINGQNIMDADYYITNFRGSQDDYYGRSKLRLYPFENEVYSINKGGMKILGIYKL